MRKTVSRAAARSAADDGGQSFVDKQNVVMWWSTALWCAALAYLLATFDILAYH